MKLFILSVCVAIALADVSHLKLNDDQAAQITEQEADIEPDGSYQWSFQTSNGISGSASGSVKNIAPGEEASQVQGAAQWVSPDGEPVSFQYIANENGYQPQGSHIPTPPPIPEAIARALQYIKDHPPPVEKN